MTGRDHIQVLCCLSPFDHIQDLERPYTLYDSNQFRVGRLSNIIRPTDLDLPNGMVCLVMGLQEFDDNIHIEIEVDIKDLDPVQVP